MGGEEGEVRMRGGRRRGGGGGKVGRGEGEERERSKDRNRMRNLLNGEGGVGMHTFELAEEMVDKMNVFSVGLFRSS